MPPGNQPPEHVTMLLNAAGRGDASAASKLLPLVYDELREMARRRMIKEPAGHTLQPTALVHEAYLRLVSDQDATWENRRHFFGAAAIAMRRILVERARKYAGPKAGGGRKRIPMDEADAGAEAPDAMDWIGLDEALGALEKHDPDLAQVVMLRYFAGLTVEQTAEVLGVSPRTVKRDWAVARAWLFKAMTGKDADEGKGEGSDGQR